MNQRLKITSLLLAIVCIPFSTSLVAEPQNLAQLKKEVVTYHDSGAYQKELNQVISSATNFIINRAKTNTQQNKLAIVLDIDETCLSNYNTLAKFQFDGTKQQWHQEILAANAPAIKPMLSLYNKAKQQGITVFFVTGRTEAERLATTKNLENAGFQGWTGLYLKPNNYSRPSVIPFKSQARADISKQGYTIIASLGDQESDLKGGYAEKTFKLPNPYYYIP